MLDLASLQRDARHKDSQRCGRWRRCARCSGGVRHERCVRHAYLAVAVPHVAL